jgi:hypothetical protein
MTAQDIVAQIPQLTIAEQLVVLDAITQSLRAALPQQPQPHESLIDHLYGAFKTSEPPPTDEVIERMRFEALMENIRNAHPARYQCPPGFLARS